jgi:hypothetical protein
VTTQPKRRASVQAHEYDLTVNEHRQRSINATDLAAALNEAEQVRQQDDDVAVWRGSRLVGAATRLGPLDLSGARPRSGLPLSEPSPAALAALRDYVGLWRSYLPHAHEDGWYEHRGGQAHCDKMHDAEQRAIRLCLGTDPRIPLEKIHHAPRAYVAGDALVVIACGFSDRDREVGTMDKNGGLYLLVVEPPTFA